jgi:hypothetical protein
VAVTPGELQSSNPNRSYNPAFGEKVSRKESRKHGHINQSKVCREQDECGDRPGCPRARRTGGSRYLPPKLGRLKRNERKERGDEHQAAKAVSGTAQHLGHGHHGRRAQGPAASRDQEAHRNRAGAQVGTPPVGGHAKHVRASKNKRSPSFCGALYFTHERSSEDRGVAGRNRS